MDILTLKKATKEAKKLITPPNSPRRWVMLNDCTDHSVWGFDSDNSTVGEESVSISTVSEVDTSDIPFWIASDAKKPWLSSRDKTIATMTKIEVSEQGSAFVYLPVPPQDFSQSGDYCAMLWVDTLSSDADSSIIVNHVLYHSVEEWFYQRYQMSYDSITSSAVGTPGDWNQFIIPNPRIMSGAYRTWIQYRPGPPFGVQHLENVRFVGLRITNNTPGKTARIYISGIFRVENELDKGKLIIEFDDGVISHYTEAFGYMHGVYGYKGNCSVNGLTVGTEGYMNINQLDEMYQQGWDITNHTWDHGALTGTGAEQYTRIKQNHDFLVSNGWSRGARTLVYPGGSHNRRTRHIAESIGVKVTRGGGYVQYHTVPGFKRWDTYSHDVGGFSEASFRARLEHIESHKLLWHVHAHTIGDTGYKPWSVANFRACIDAIGDYDVDVLSWSDWIDQYVLPDMIN